ncbi:MAG: GGDEF domain-containing protein [Spirochaetes bacterium]|nr:GGDEF domain-containing protein [Spirochaetota bacterium]MBU1080169.1 GGDEF domain-containing protein [Spirochaetota bacterium]
MSDANEQAKDRSADILSQYNKLSQTGAIENLEALRKENRELDRLITDAAALIALPSVPLMLDFVIDKVLERFVPEFLAFVIEPPRGTRLSQFCYRNLKPSDETIPIECYKRLKDHFLSKPFSDHFEAIRDQTGEYPGLKAYSPELIFPMRGISGLYGIVVMGRKVVGETYSDLERMYIDRLSRFLSVGIQNGLHHQSSITDAKTGLYNHDFFMHRLEEEISRCGRNKSSACVLMLDVDYFKRFNDRYGHMAGDVALESLATAIKGLMRSSDAVARFGGEEFCVLAVDCDVRSALEVAERIRAEVESLRIDHGGESLSITVSIGARMLDSRAEAKQVLDDADKALYASKAGGRNRCSLFRPGLLGRASLARTARTGAQAR